MIDDLPKIKADFDAWVAESVADKKTFGQTYGKFKRKHNGRWETQFRNEGPHWNLSFSITMRDEDWKKIEYWYVDPETGYNSKVFYDAKTHKPTDDMEKACKK